MTTVDYILMGVVALFAMLDVILSVKNFKISEESQSVESESNNSESNNNE